MFMLRGNLTISILVASFMSTLTPLIIFYSYFFEDSSKKKLVEEIIRYSMIYEEKCKYI